MAAPSSFGGGLLIYAACAVAAWMAWPLIKAAFGPDTTPYTSPEPHDRAGAQRGGYSPYFPGPRTMRAPGMHLDPNEVSPNIEDRRGEHGPFAEARPAGGDGARCWDRIEHQNVPLSFCDQQDGGRRR